MTAPRAQPGGYCPYDIVRDVETLGLRSATTPTAFGDMHAVLRTRTDAPLTLFMHGIGGTWSSWTPLLQAAQEERVDLGALLIVDLPGFGASQNLLGSLDSGRVGETLLDVAAQLGYQRVRLIGQSMGAFLALDMAARFPDRVTHVNALAGSFRGILEVGRAPVSFAMHHLRATTENVSIFALNRLGALGRRGARRLRRWGVRTLFDEVVAHPEQLKPVARRSVSQGFTARNMRLAARNARTPDALVSWTTITARAAFMWGELDPLVPPSEAAAIGQLLPGASRTVIGDAAHIMHVERPFEVLSSLRL